MARNQFISVYMGNVQETCMILDVLDFYDMLRMILDICVGLL